MRDRLDYVSPSPPRITPSSGRGPLKPTALKGHTALSIFHNQQAEATEAAGAEEPKRRSLEAAIQEGSDLSALVRVGGLGVSASAV